MDQSYLQLERRSLIFLMCHIASRTRQLLISNQARTLPFAAEPSVKTHVCSTRDRNGGTYNPTTLNT